MGPQTVNSFLHVKLTSIIRLKSEVVYQFYVQTAQATGSKCFQNSALSLKWHVNIESHHYAGCSQLTAYLYKQTLGTPWIGCAKVEIHTLYRTIHKLPTFHTLCTMHTSTHSLKSSSRILTAMMNIHGQRDHALCRKWGIHTVHFSTGHIKPTSRGKTLFKLCSVLNYYHSQEGSHFWPAYSFIYMYMHPPPDPWVSCMVVVYLW